MPAEIKVEIKAMSAKDSPANLQHISENLHLKTRRKIFLIVLNGLLQNLNNLELIPAREKEYKLKEEAPKIWRVFDRVSKVGRDRFRSHKKELHLKVQDKFSIPAHFQNTTNKTNKFVIK